MKLNFISTGLIFGIHFFPLGLCVAINNKARELTEPAELARPISVPSYSPEIQQSRDRTINGNDPSLVDSSKAVTLEQTRILKRGRPWKGEEEELLLQLREEGKSWAEIDEFFPERSWKALQGRYYILLSGPPKTRTYRINPWTDEETELLLKLVDDNLSWKEIAKRLPGRSEGSSRERYRILKESSAPTSNWKQYTAEDDDAILKALKSGKTVKEISQLLERDQSSVRKRIRTLEESEGLDPAPQTMSGRFYADADFELMRRERERNITWKKISANHFPGRSADNVRRAYKRFLQQQKED